LLPAVGAIVAIWGVLTQRAVARRRATMDHMARVDMDNDMIAARKDFITLAKAPGGLALWAETEHEASDEMAAIRLILNDFELVSVAIQYGIMDYDFYKLYNHGTVRAYWEASAPFIHALRQRKGRRTLFHEFEDMACWIDKGLRPPRKRLWVKKYIGV
jgi:Domain of unknown function (DUF4760)